MLETRIGILDEVRLRERRALVWQVLLDAEKNDFSFPARFPAAIAAVVPAAPAPTMTIGPWSEFSTGLPFIIGLRNTPRSGSRISDLYVDGRVFELHFITTQVDACRQHSRFACPIVEGSEMLWTLDDVSVDDPIREVDLFMSAMPIESEVVAFQRAHDHEGLSAMVPAERFLGLDGISRACGHPFTCGSHIGSSLNCWYRAVAGRVSAPRWIAILAPTSSP